MSDQPSIQVFRVSLSARAFSVRWMRSAMPAKVSETPEMALATLPRAAAGAAAAEGLTCGALTWVPWRPGISRARIMPGEGWAS